MTALSRLVDKRMTERDLSNRMVAELSSATNCPAGTVSQAAVGIYRHHAPAKPSDRILRVLSWTLDIPLAELIGVLLAMILAMSTESLGSTTAVPARAS